VVCLKKIMILTLILIMLCSCNAEVKQMAEDTASKGASMIAKAADKTGLTDNSIADNTPKSNKTAENTTNKTVSKPKEPSELSELFIKYQYDCSYSVDHATFDYEMQQGMIEKCQDRCCGGKFCTDCQWPGSMDCYAKCDAEMPEGICANCDGVCWDYGYGKWIHDKIASC
jgi:hypothetical protein